MHATQLNGTVFTQISSQDFKDKLLDRINSHRGIGANPSMGTIFMSRIEKLADEFNASSSTPESLRRILEGMESDFGTIECYNEFIQALKQALDKRLP